MIKAKKGISPIYVHYYDNQAGSVYNLTKDQFDMIMESEDGQAKGIEAADMFEIELNYEVGYAPDVVTTLAKIYGFEVDSE